MLEFVHVLGSWLFTKHQKILFGSRFSLHFLDYGFAPLTNWGNSDFFWQLDKLRKFSIYETCCLIAYAIFGHVRYTDVICLHTNLLSKLWDEHIEAFYKKGHMTFSFDLMGERKILPKFAYWLRNCIDGRWQLGVAEIILIIAVEVFRMPKLLVDCS